MSDPDQITDVPPQRLCCEIQLFELCDLCSCNDKSGRFCTNPELLDRFEKIAEDELRINESFLSEEDDEGDGNVGDAYYQDDENDEAGGENGDGWELEE